MNNRTGLAAATPGRRCVPCEVGCHVHKGSGASRAQGCSSCCRPRCAACPNAIRKYRCRTPRRFPFACWRGAFRGSQQHAPPARPGVFLELRWGYHAAPQFIRGARSAGVRDSKPARSTPGWPGSDSARSSPVFASCTRSTHSASTVTRWRRDCGG